MGLPGPGGAALGGTFGGELAISTQHWGDSSAAVMALLLLFAVDPSWQEIDIEMQLPDAATLLVS